jgi:hypothetical protein
MADENLSGYNRFQYSFFTPEGGQIVVRADTASELKGSLDDLLAEVDETEGPGLLSTIQTIKAAGLIKDVASKSSGTSGGQSASRSSSDSSMPQWLVAKAEELGGTPRMGTKNGKTWYAVQVGDKMNWQNAPRG